MNSVAPEIRLLIIALDRVVAAVGSLTTEIKTMSHDIRSMREKFDVIESRIPYRPKAANGE